VFVHADELAGRVTARTGIPVEFEVIDTQRGPKAHNVRPSGQRLPDEVARAAADEGRGSADFADADMCDAIPSTAYATEITDTLLSVVPTMTAAQILEVRNRLIVHARARGWLVD
jgi:hypothetical protein